MRHHFNPTTLCGSSRSLAKDENGHQDALAKICDKKRKIRTKSLEDAKATFQRPCIAVWHPDLQEYVRMPWSSMRQYKTNGFIVEELW